MSLHIGGLSVAVRKQYLERVFQKFGRCTVRLKDGYGFAVFGASDDAARALRHLHGKFVCGKRITVNWSKHQPNLSHSSRSSRRVKSSNGRASRDGMDSFRFSDPADQKNDYTSRGMSHNPDDGVEKRNHHTSHDNSKSPDDVVEKNMDTLRFSDPADQKNDYTSHGMSHNPDDGVGNRNHHMSHDNSQSPDDVVEKNPDEKSEGLKDAGESIGEDPVEMKMDEGGTGDANAIEHDRWGETGIGNHGGDDDDFDRFEPYHGYNKQDKKEKTVKADHRRFSKKWQRHPAERFDQNHGKSRSLPACYRCGAACHTSGNCPEKTVGKFRTLGDRLSLREKGELRLRKFRYSSTRRPESHVDTMTQAHQRVQDTRKPFSDRIGGAPKLSNVPTLNRRHAPQSENMPQVPKEAHNGSKLKRSREPSLSSGRPSSYSRSGSPYPRSRAESPSHSAYSSSKSSQPVQPECLKLRSRSNTSQHGLLSLSKSDSPQSNSPRAAGNKNIGGLLNSPLESNSDLKAASEFKHFDDCKQEVKGSNNCEVPSTSSKLDTLSNGDQPVPGKGDKVPVHVETTVYKDMIDGSVGIVAHGVQGQKTSPDDTLSVMKSNKEHVVKNRRCISLKLTTNEVVSALKHYGVEAREIVLTNQPVESYFGAARLWPWEIIYYRRSKKGPISTENYAKRLEQNKEFGIVDQYVRSSSGWWECHKNTT